MYFENKIKLMLIILAVSLSSCVSTRNEETISVDNNVILGFSLQDAIKETVNKIIMALPNGGREAIVAFESTSDSLSQYIIEELTVALFDKRIEVVDQQNLEYVFQELNFQLSGFVSDETAKSIGKSLEADIVVNGSFSYQNGTFLYRVSRVNVKTGIGNVTRLDVEADETIWRMIASSTNEQTTTKTVDYGLNENR